MVGAMRDGHAAQHLFYTLLTLLLGYAKVGQRQFHVLLDIEFVDQVETLEHEAYLPFAYCRAVVMNPKLILADEPTGNLDSKNGLEVMQLLTQLNQEGTTVLMVTHSERDAGYAQRIINLLDGQVVPEVKL